jgi:hypothetical protein
MKCKLLEKVFEEACSQCNYEQQEAILVLESAHNQKVLQRIRLEILEANQKK